MKKIYLVGMILIFTLATAAIGLAETKSEISPDAALSMLKEGNSRFVNRHARHPNGVQRTKPFELFRGRMVEKQDRPDPGAA